MPGKATISLGNLTLDTMLYLSAVTFPTLGASAQGTNTATVPGVQLGDLISFNLISPPAHLFLDNAYVSSANTITFLWSADASGISTSTVAMLLGVSRGDTIPYTSLPASIV